MFTRLESVTENRGLEWCDIGDPDFSQQAQLISSMKHVFSSRPAAATDARLSI